MLLFFLEISESLDYSAVSCGSSVGNYFICFSFKKESKSLPVSTLKRSGSGFTKTMGKECCSQI